MNVMCATLKRVDLVDWSSTWRQSILEAQVKKGIKTKLLLWIFSQVSLKIAFSYYVYYHGYFDILD